MQKILTLLATLAACSAIAYFLWPISSDHVPDETEALEEYVQLTADQLKAHDIETAAAGPGVLQEVVRAPAKITIAADKIAHIFPKASGIIISAGKNLGESVAANEVLVSLESKEMAEAQAYFLSALKKEQLKRSVYEQEKILHKQKISAKQDFRTAKMEWEEALIDLELAGQRLCALGLCQQEISALPKSETPLRIYEVRSPIKGNIISQHATSGELVSNDHLLYIVADLGTVWAEISVFSRDRQKIQKGQSVLISTQDGKKAQAEVVYLSPIIDEDTRTSTIIAEIDNGSGMWLPGTFVQTELTTQSIPVALMVPKEAVQNIDGKDSLFVAEKEGFAQRPVTLGRADELSYEVLSGLLPGEIYASKNTFLLKADLKKAEAEHMD